MTYRPTRDLLVGLAGEIASAGLGTYGTVVADPNTGIYLKALPTSPARAVALTVYASTDEAVVTLSQYRVQVWCRGKADLAVDVDDLADDIFSVLQGLENRTYASVHLAQCLRISSVSLGADGSKRFERSDNYEVHLDTPATPGRPW